VLVCTVFGELLCFGQYSYVVHKYEDLFGKVFGCGEFDEYVGLFVNGINYEITKYNLAVEPQGVDPVELVNLQDPGYKEFHSVCRGVREQLRN